MSSSYASTLTLSAGGVLLMAVVVMWLSSVRAVVRTMAAQGIALGLVVVILGVHLHDVGLMATAAVVVAIKGVAIPVLLSKAAGDTDPHNRERRPLVNVPASLVASGVLIALAFAAARGVAAFVGTTAGTLVPVGVATLLLGFFALVSRRRPVFSMVGLLLVDNGVALVAFLSTAGVPFLIELGVSLDVLLGVAVLMVLAQRLRAEFGDVDLDELSELHD